MKRFLGILGIVISLVILTPMVALADPPPDTKVEVVVISGGDVDVNLDVTAPSANIIVDGVDIKSTLDDVNRGLGAVSGNIGYLYSELWEAQASLESLWKTYNEGVPLTQKQIDEMKQVINLLSDATAILIVKENALRVDSDSRNSATSWSLANLQTGVKELNMELDTLEAEQAKSAAAFNSFASDTKINYETLVNAINDLKVQDRDQKIRIDGLVRLVIAIATGTVISLILWLWTITRKKAK